jgi:DNA polymerase sigma
MSSSYAYILMIIHFLQSRSPPILPCLQRIGDPPFTPTIVEGVDVSFFKSIEELHRYNFNASANIEKLDELLIAFFRYYATEYNYTSSIISIRHGGLLLKSQEGWLNDGSESRHYLYIEDPFDVTHNLGRVVTQVGFCMIQEEFMRAHKMLSNHQSLADLCQSTKMEYMTMVSTILRDGISQRRHIVKTTMKC